MQCLEMIIMEKAERIIGTTHLHNSSQLLDHRGVEIFLLYKVEDQIVISQAVQQGIIRKISEHLLEIKLNSFVTMTHAKTLTVV